MKNNQLNLIHNSNNLITHNIVYTNLSLLERRETFTKEKNDYIERGIKG